MMRANIHRLFSIGRALVRHGLGYVAATRLPNWPRLRNLIPTGNLDGPERLRDVLEELGGTFIKLGQMLALQPDVLPFAYCNALFDLLDRVAAFDVNKVRKVFDEELGRAPEQIFENFSESPIATASIGQVHIGYIDGRKLVVKIQRPQVDTEFMGDIRLMTTALGMIKRLHLSALYWLIEPIGEFVAWTREELDYRHEARYMEQLRQNASENSRERIPLVYWQYSTRRLLVLEYFDGVTLIDCLRVMENGNPAVKSRLEDMGFDPNQFARNIIDNFLGDVFRYGMFHADLHPANLIIMPENMVGYVDFGITGVLSHYSRKELVSLTLAYTRADLDGMSRSFFKVSSMDENSDIAGFRQGLQRYGDEWYEARGNKSRLRKNFTLVMLDMLRLSRRTGIWPERDVIKYIRSAIALDGLITRFAPEFDVGGYLEISCARYMKDSVRPQVSAETLVDWSLASSHLVRDGAYQMVTLLDQLSNPEGQSDGPQENGTDAQRVLLLGVVVVTTALLIPTLGSDIALGFNIFTAMCLLLTTTSLMLLRTAFTLR
ncbi:MAG: AarF/ABC1/UbiB kinase family protein [Candidatus Latescibacteria bacterium]|jgi:ubiquinone biosynthesis protein|nr:AarF/ABC1/UbiB kinase family protein [Candidatus Latescibacterota bacterium]